MSIDIPPAVMALSIATAKLPTVYESAKDALAQCDRIDECKDWADKAEALASYARQAGDDSLRKTADKIQARAIRRCGELLQAVKAQSGKRTDMEPRDGTDPRLIGEPSRKEAARDAGMSERQQKTALRVAAVPPDEFEQAVESDTPPTVTQLAERGTKAAPKPIVDLGGRSVEDFQACTAALGVIRHCLEMIEETTPDAIMRGASENERQRMQPQLARILKWFTALRVAIAPADSARMADDAGPADEITRVAESMSRAVKTLFSSAQRLETLCRHRRIGISSIGFLALRGMLAGIDATLHRTLSLMGEDLMKRTPLERLEPDMTNEALQQMVDLLLSMPPSERQAFVARAMAVADSQTATWNHPDFRWGNGLPWGGNSEK